MGGAGGRYYSSRVRGLNRGVVSDGHRTFGCTFHSCGVAKGPEKGATQGRGRVVGHLGRLAAVQRSH